MPYAGPPPHRGQCFRHLRNVSKLAIVALGIHTLRPGGIGPPDWRCRRESHRHSESTKYRGSHYVDCYVVKDGRVVAKDRQPVFVV